MLVIFKTGGKQYSAKAGQILKVEKLKGNKGDSISFNYVLAVNETSNNTIGSPVVKGASVQAKILEQIRDKKIIVFKKRQRQNYRHTQGHRQYLTVVQIESIILGDKKSSISTKEVIKKVTKVNIPDKNEKKTVTPVAKKKAAPKKAITKKKAAPKKATVKKKTIPKKEIKK